MTSIIRGIRNNNPLNLRISPAQWLGKVPMGQRTDKSFEQFTIPGQPFEPGNPDQRVYGYRAAIRNLRTYIRTRNRRTIDRIIDAWAPASDGNNPSNYKATVSRLSGIPILKELQFEEAPICKLVAAMAQVESAIPYGKDDQLIHKAWSLCQTC